LTGEITPLPGYACLYFSLDGDANNTEDYSIQLKVFISKSVRNE